MRGNPILTLFIFSAIILLIDYYTFTGLKKIEVGFSLKTKRILNIIFWSIPGIIFLGILFLFMFRESSDPAYAMVYVHSLSGIFLAVYIPKIFFILFNIIDDIWHSAKWAAFKIKRTKTDDSEGKKITRNQFLTRAGLIISGLPFVSIIYGIAWGRFDFIVRKSNVEFENLPEAFNGFKIAQISDFHIGSYLTHKEKVEEIVKLINTQNPDVVLFTGDFVNNVSEEADEFVSILSKMKAKFGVYSVLGNHDYGEYVPWDSPAKKAANLHRLISLQEDMGFNVLLNSNEKIQIGNEFITLIGVENWGLPPFPQYGDLGKATSGVEKDTFKILMTHDPTHWDEQVLGYTNIDLTLSGHTHGAQFGIEIPGWRWSPVDLRYKRWGGVYREGNQVLNVNTGIGFIGFPGRVGMPPEVGLITLNRV
ncbi:MAG: metallophosphoesterase [Bacteroidota bacterium]